MNTFRTRNAPRVRTRAHRLDPRQESRCYLALIMLMGFAAVSVMATTQAVSSTGTGPSSVYLLR